MKWKIQILKVPIQKANLNRNMAVSILSSSLFLPTHIYLFISYLYLIHTEKYYSYRARHENTSLSLKPQEGCWEFSSCRHFFNTLTSVISHQSRQTTRINQHIFQLSGQLHANEFISVCSNSSSGKWTNDTYYPNSHACSQG